jgi:hypothetical protein
LLSFATLLRIADARRTTVFGESPASLTCGDPPPRTFD